LSLEEELVCLDMRRRRVSDRGEGGEEEEDRHVEEAKRR